MKKIFAMIALTLTFAAVAASAAPSALPPCMPIPNCFPCAS
jgi:hypothetical protein